MIGSTSENPGPKPMEIAPWSHRVGFTFVLPKPIGSPKIGPLLAPKVIGGSFLCSSMVHFMGPHVLLEVLGRVHHGARFQQGYLDSHLGQGMNHRSTAGTGADYDDVIDL